MNNKNYDFAISEDIEELNSLISLVNKDTTHDHQYGLLNEYDINESHKKIFFVKRDNNQIKCFLSFHCKNSFQNDDDATFEVFAHPNFKKLGYGSFLIDQVEEYAINETGISKIEIGVLKTNEKAKRLYIRKGYASASNLNSKGE